MTICVFCGSHPGSRPLYSAATSAFGQALVRAGHDVVYGGGNIGLMGVLADAVLAAGGRIHGVIPQALVDREQAHRGLTKLTVVPNMHARKAAMAEAARAFVALPGGLGTLEELFEVTTWAYLGIHRKPIGLLDVDGYFDPLLQMIDHAVDQGFVSPEHRRLLVVGRDPASLLESLSTHRMPTIPQAIDPAQK